MLQCQNELVMKNVTLYYEGPRIQFRPIMISLSSFLNFSFFLSFRASAKTTSTTDTAQQSKTFSVYDKPRKRSSSEIGISTSDGNESNRIGIGETFSPTTIQHSRSMQALKTLGMTRIHFSMMTESRSLILRASDTPESRPEV